MHEVYHQFLAGKNSFDYWLGCAVAQAVSRWLPTAAVRAACGDCGGQSGTGAGFLRVLRFPLPMHHSTNFSITITTRCWHNRPIGGRSAEWTQLDTSPSYSLTYGAEPFLRSCQLCSHSGTSQHFKEPEGSSPCSQEPFPPPL
jgi:hypothetical protein